MTNEPILLPAPGQEPSRATITALQSGGIIPWTYQVFANAEEYFFGVGGVGGTGLTAPSDGPTGKRWSDRRVWDPSPHDCVMVDRDNLILPLYLPTGGLQGGASVAAGEASPAQPAGSGFQNWTFGIYGQKVSGYLQDCLRENPQSFANNVVRLRRVTVPWAESRRLNLQVPVATDYPIADAGDGTNNNPASWPQDRFIVQDEGRLWIVPIGWKPRNFAATISDAERVDTTAALCAAPISLAEKVTRLKSLWK